MIFLRQETNGRNKRGSGKPGHLCSGDGEAPRGRDPTASRRNISTGRASLQGKARLWSRRAELPMAVTVCPRAGDHPGHCLWPLPLPRITGPSAEKGPSSSSRMFLTVGRRHKAPTAASLLWGPHALAPHAVLTVARRGRAPGVRGRKSSSRNGRTGQHTGGGQEGRGQRSRPENTEPRRSEAQRARPPPRPTARTASLGPRQALAPQVGALAQKASFQGRYAFPGATGAKHTGQSLKRGWAVSVWRPESNIKVWVGDGGASVPGPAPASGALLANYGVFRFVDDSPTAACTFPRPRPACTPVSKLPISQEHRPLLQ